MFPFLEYRLTLHRLRKTLSKKELELLQISKIANTPDGQAEGSSLYQEKEKTLNYINYIQTKYYLNICQDLIIPAPNFNDNDIYYKYDFDDEEGEKYIFTTIGFHHIRKLIREEKKEKRETFGYWIAIIFGLIGAFTGLLSTL